MKALIVIDYTNDFVASDGALTAGEPAQALEPVIHRLIDEFAKEDLVVYAVDCHDKDNAHHPETKLFPPHNIIGTEGRFLFRSIGEQYHHIAAQDNVLWMDKRRYSAFTGTDLLQRLNEHRIQEIYLCGVCTDICVLHTAVDAYNLGFNITVYDNAVASFNPAGHEWALTHFRNTLGASVKTL